EEEMLDVNALASMGPRLSTGRSLSTWNDYPDRTQAASMGPRLSTGRSIRRGPALGVPLFGASMGPRLSTGRSINEFYAEVNAPPSLQWGPVSRRGGAVDRDRRILIALGASMGPRLSTGRSPHRDRRVRALQRRFNG